MSLEKLVEENKIQRRDIRYHIFRIRDGIDLTLYPEFENFVELKTIIETQFVQGMTWENFTFDWDVSSKNPLKVITQFEWDGRIDKFLNKCDPPAFTKQGI